MAEHLKKLQGEETSAVKKLETLLNVQEKY